MTGSSRGGDSSVNANRPAVGPWETFGLVDYNGGGVQHGDAVSFATSNYPGQQSFLSAISGGGSGVTAKDDPFGYGVFQIYRISGAGAVAPGDIIYLRALSGHYMVAIGGGGGVVNASSPSVGTWEQFRIAP